MGVKKAEDQQKIAILDAGSQYGKVIDRRIRELSVYSDILPINTSYEELKSYSGIIISGGPGTVNDPDAPRPDTSILEGTIPLLGICFGMQWMNQALSGKVTSLDRREDSETTITIDTSSVLFSGLEETEQVLMSHGDSIDELSPKLETIGTSGDIIAAVKHVEKNIFGTQFHPEVDLTESGSLILENFLERICNCDRSYQLPDRINETMERIKLEAKDKVVLCLVSGGVDSAVTATLVSKALPENQVRCLHINNGLMREGESEYVIQALKDAGVKNIEYVNATAQFLNGTTTVDGNPVGPLNTLTDPERKRQIIGDMFMEVTDRTIKQMALDFDKVVIAQGTLRPDLIESASEEVSSVADVIKTHHNDTALVRQKREQGLVIETNKDWHKDEVREVGRQLGLPESIINRHPFPGPGMGVRVLCLTQPDVDPDRDQAKDYAEKLLQEAKIVAYPFVLPIRSVGVQGDARTFKHPLVIFMEHKENLPWGKLKEIANEIPKICHSINRVCVCFDQKLPKVSGSITPTLLTEDILSIARAADLKVWKIMDKHKLLRKIAQLPVVLTPADCGQKGKHSIVLRPFITNDFMTGLPAIPNKDIPESVIKEMQKAILEIPEIAYVFYDLTSKPPGTTEWE